MPSSSYVESVENEIGAIFQEEGLWKLSFKSFKHQRVLFDEINSGNTHAIVMPATLPEFTFLRLKVKDKV